MKLTIARKKNKKYPKIPQSLQEVQSEFSKPEILNKFGYNLDGDAKFYLGSCITEEYQFIVFYSDFVANFIRENIPVGSRYYLMDGTFDSLPKGVYQLLTISIAYENNVSIFKFIYFACLINGSTAHPTLLFVRPSVCPHYFYF